MDKKRVWTLYRVSTKSQVNADEDIPMQRNACYKMVEQNPNWEITNELYERGVSGWKKSADDRDELTQIKEGAVRGDFDILLIFLSDRLGRKKDETPFIIEFLKKNGVSVYSVNEGELKSEDHTDSLINYIRYWQAEGESLKTSIRVTEQLKQMNEQGLYTGGNSPFGYKLVDTNIKHPKKDRFLKELKVDESQAKVIRLIFELSAFKNYGRHKIASYLNERGYVNQFGKKFNDKFIWRLLLNPIYIGRKRYGVVNHDSDNIEFKTQPYNETLRIVEDDIFYKSMELINKRKFKNKKENDKFKSGKPHSSQVLLSGLIKCGYCGEFMKTDFSYKTYKRKTDHKTTKMITYRYRCKNAQNGIIHHEKKQVGAKTIDSMMESLTKSYLRTLNMSHITEEFEKEKDSKTIEKELELKQLESLLSKKRKYLNVLNEEIPKSLMGESSFSPEILNKSISQTEIEITEINNNITNLQEAIKTLKEKSNEIDSVNKILHNWEERYDNADLETKKVMISDIVKYVEWKKDELNPIFTIGRIDHVL
ncbi:recombinase family protein [Halalkalibacter oceani]|uniref:recombinase family protein n=1 Tax=Halalkalibacter oceani TaxID=1653776 RepID=UPI0033928989